MGELRNINGLIMEKGEDGRWTILVTSTDGSERAYLCIAKENGEVVMLHETRKEYMTPELLLHPHAESEDNLVCYELTAEEYDDLKEQSLHKWSLNESHADENFHRREIKGRVRNKQMQLYDASGRFVAHAKRNIKEIEDEIIRARMEKENKIKAETEIRRQIALKNKMKGKGG